MRESILYPKDNSRTQLYLHLKRILMDRWKFNIYRGVRPKKNGQLKISLRTNYTAAHLSGFWMNVKLISKDYSIDDFVISYM